MTPEQKQIERAYQRAMDIRDSTPGNVAWRLESRYTEAYLSAFRQGDSRGFRCHTSRYLRAVRAAAVTK